MLEGVLGPGGTASQVSIPGYQLAGKTGTASKVDPETGEYSQSKYVASFIGFAPASDPKLLCAVVVDEPQPGLDLRRRRRRAGVRADHGLRAAIPGDRPWVAHAPGRRRSRPGGLLPLE